MGIRGNCAVIHGNQSLRTYRNVFCRNALAKMKLFVSPFSHQNLSNDCLLSVLQTFEAAFFEVLLVRRVARS